MKTYEFSEEEVAHLLTFLNRTQIGGSEAGNMNNLQTKLSEPFKNSVLPVAPIQPIQVED